VLTGPIRWGIAGTGEIAGLFAATLGEVPGAAAAAVSSGTSERAAAFASAHGIARAVVPHEAIADTPVDAVYVAATNDRHRDIAVACLDAGIPVLVEKPVALDLGQAEDIADAARRSGTFVMEAWWTRFLPFWDTAVRLVDEMGPLRWLQADLGFPAERSGGSGRLWSPAAGGGALLDVGVYPLTFAHLLAGPPLETRAVAVLTDEGVDAQVGVTSRHEGGVVSVLSASLVADTSLTAVLAGPEGRVTVHAPFHHSRRVTVHRAGDLVAEHPVPYRGTGYRYEVEEVHRCLAEGLPGSPARPFSDTLAVMGWMDEVRRQIGVRFPGE